MDHDYYDTFIAVAEDCKVVEAKVPEPRGGKPTLQYEMLSEPFRWKQSDVLFEVWLARQADLDSDSLAADERAAIRDEFFAKGQPCLRASPLTKTHGWGVVFDGEGRAALAAMESAEYQEHLDDADLTTLKAMRSKRA